MIQENRDKLKKLGPYIRRNRRHRNLTDELTLVSVIWIIDIILPLWHSTICLRVSEEANIVTLTFEIQLN